MNDEQALPEEEALDYEVVEEPPRHAKADDDPARPRRRKKSRGRSLDDLRDNHAIDNPSERYLPLGVLWLGIAMSFAAAAGIGGKGFAFRAVVEMFVYLIFLLPLSVGTLMLVGTYAGVSYGEFKLAILKLSAIAFFNNGIMWLNAWAGAPSYMAMLLCSFICFGLFMMIYDLDVWEAWISIIALNAVEFTAHIFVMVAIASAANHAKKKEPKPPIDESCIQRMMEA